MDGVKWYSRLTNEVIDYWKTDQLIGLSSNEAKLRFEKFGSNEIECTQSIIWWKILLYQFQDFMVLILMAATLISAILGEYTDAVTILAIVLLNAAMGFIQEYRAEQSMSALRRLAAPSARVIRNGNTQQIAAREVVPGDIIVLESGDKIAADGRLIEVQNLEVEEAALTGESHPVRKTAEATYREDTTIGDRKNMVYAGTNVTRGRGKLVVCTTGMRTEVGCIAEMLKTTEHEPTPLEVRMEHLGRWLVWGCLIICLLVVITGIAKGEPILIMCMAGISLAVAAIPEGLPAIVTIALALGVQRMLKRNAIIRKLPAVETLGCVTCICSDKTGTLTQNAMTVTKIFTDNKMFEVTGTGYDIKGSFLYNEQEVNPKHFTALQKCLEIAACCNNSTLVRNNIGITGLWRKNSNTWSIQGDPTEGALVVAAAKADLWREKLEQTKPRIFELPFESDRRRMSVGYRKNNANQLYIKGAADTVLELCRYYSNGNIVQPLTRELTRAITDAHDVMTSQALRVLAIAYRQLSDEESKCPDESLENELIFVGLIGMIDPPREEAKKAILQCKKAGIMTVMITGDHKDTAVAIAEQLQIFNADRNKVFTGQELDRISDNDFKQMVNEITVYARVSPAHKLKIVRALKKNGHIVAMTGDGVNDAPAIKEADIGIAMGINGTDVTKEASAMVLTDDNFASIVAAIEEGRGIYDNIRKFIRYLLSCNLGEVLTMFIGAVVGLPLPLLPVQILWVNLVTDGLPAMALGVDPSSPDIMNRPPRNPKESLFSRGLSKKILSRGVQIGLSAVLVFAFSYIWIKDLALARTMAFTTLVFSQMFHIFDCRSEIQSVFEVGLFRNKYLVVAAATSIIMQLTVIYCPLLQQIFTTVPLSLMDWLVILVVSGWTFALNGIKHIFFRINIAKLVTKRVQYK